jgi:hypothetical protein
MKKKKSLSRGNTHIGFASSIHNKQTTGFVWRVHHLPSVGFGSSWMFSVIFLNIACGSTLFISLHISFVYVGHDECS